MINPKEFVSLRLNEKPGKKIQEDGRAMLLLSLTDISSEQLKQFTQKHVGGRIAMGYWRKKRLLCIRSEQ